MIELGWGLQSLGKGDVALSLMASPGLVLLSQPGNTAAEALSGETMPAKASSEGPAKSWDSTHPFPLEAAGTPPY